MHGRTRGGVGACVRACIFVAAGAKTCGPATVAPPGSPQPWPAAKTCPVARGRLRGGQNLLGRPSWSVRVNKACALKCTCARANVWMQAGLATVALPDEAWAFNCTAPCLARFRSLEVLPPHRRLLRVSALAFGRVLRQSSLRRERLGPLSAYGRPGVLHAHARTNVQCCMLSLVHKACVHARITQIHSICCACLGVVPQLRLRSAGPFPARRRPL